MIGIFAVTGLAGGFAVVHERPTSTFRNRAARVRVVATLDGGAVLDHAGFSHADTTWTVDADLSEAQALALETLHQTQAQLMFTHESGVFLGAIEQLNTDTLNPARIVILISEKLADE